jgi:hypothetical protein
MTYRCPALVPVSAMREKQLTIFSLFLSIDGHLDEDMVAPALLVQEKVVEDLQVDMAMGADGYREL